MWSSVRTLANRFTSAWSLSLHPLDSWSVPFCVTNLPLEARTMLSSCLVCHTSTVEYPNINWSFWAFMTPCMRLILLHLWTSNHVNKGRRVKKGVEEHGRMNHIMDKHGRVDEVSSYRRINAHGRASPLTCLPQSAHYNKKSNISLSWKKSLRQGA